MSAVIYIRVSSDEQVSGTSLESQERACRAFATQQGLEIAAVYADRGESAKTADRPEFQKMIRKCVAESGLRALIVWKLDRFARNHYDYLFPGGLTYSMKHGLRTATTPHTINALQQNLTNKNKVAPQNVLTWNRVVRFVLTMNEAERAAA